MRRLSPWKIGFEKLSKRRVPLRPRGRARMSRIGYYSEIETSEFGV
jgi:hypothetical protein